MRSNPFTCKSLHMLAMVAPLRGAARGRLVVARPWAGTPFTCNSVPSSTWLRRRFESVPSDRNAILTSRIAIVFPCSECRVKCRISGLFQTAGLDGGGSKLGNPAAPVQFELTMTTMSQLA